MSTFGWMRLLFALVVCVVVLTAPAAARADDVTLWACHGPDGTALPISYDATRSAGAFVKPTSLVACAGRADSIRLGFTNPTPPEGSSAALRMSAPAGVQVEGVWLGRRVTGPGYFARTSVMDLEGLEAGGTLDGVFTRPATGTWVELGLRCASAGCDMAQATLDFRSLALTVNDPAAPAFSFSGLGPSATGVVRLTVDAHDDGLGLADVSATLGGAPAGAGSFGGTECQELSPGDATVDLPMADDCPASRRLTLALDTTVVPDGVHRLELTVTDGAGNASVKGTDLQVVNHAPAAVTPAPTPVRTPTRPPTTTVPPVPNVIVLGPVGRYKSGAVSVEATCPARAATSCPVSLTLRAKLPGSRRTATIARARSSVKPGANTRLKLKLSAAARRALTKRRTLTATLTPAGARPLSVTVRRG